MAYSKKLKIPLFVESLLTLPVANIDQRANCSAVLLFDQPSITNDNLKVLPQLTTLLIDNNFNAINESKNLENKFEIKKLNNLLHQRTERSNQSEVDKINLVILPKKNFNNLTPEIAKGKINFITETTTTTSIKQNDDKKVCQDTAWNKPKWISLFPDNGKIIFNIKILFKYDL